MLRRYFRRYARLGIWLAMLIAVLVATASSVVAAPPVRLWISSDPKTLSVGECSTAVTVTRYDSNSIPSNEPVNTVVRFRGEHFQYFSQANCSGAISTITIPAGSHSAVFYIRPLRNVGYLPITVTGTGMAGGTQYVTVSPAAPRKLQFRVMPMDPMYSAVALPTVEVAVLDLYDNLVTSASLPVTLRLEGGLGNATISGSLSVVPENGVARFSNIRFAGTGRGYNFAALSTGLTTAYSVAFEVTSAPVGYVPPGSQPTPSPSSSSGPSPAPSPSSSGSPVPNPSPSASSPPVPSPNPSPSASTSAIVINPIGLSHIWANDGGDKIPQEDLRAKTTSSSVTNSVFDGSRINLFGARNEVLGFNLVLEAGNGESSNVRVQFNRLEGPNGFVIGSQQVAGDAVFNYTNRDIELFYVRYLQIRGLSRLSYETYDERHIPEKFQRPWTGSGIGSGSWTDRPDHNKHYPDIAIPLEAIPIFSVSGNRSQSIWVDVYIPKNAPPGFYTGTVTVYEGAVDNVAFRVPVRLQVRNFTLPDVPSSKTMLFLGYNDIARRYTGETYPNSGTPAENTVKLVRNRHFQMAHRHKISIIDADPGATVWNQDRPRDEWLPRLNGSLYTAANGYRGPGEGVGNNVYSIGTYGTWNWQSGGEAAMRARTDAWETWFAQNYPNVERFLYLIDESTNYPQTQQWASWMANNPGPGRNLKSFATISYPSAANFVPSLNLAAAWFAVADSSSWQAAFNTLLGRGNAPWMYNGKRPASGSFATEDSGVSLREIPWGQYKMRIGRWFFWEGTYYNDYQGGRGQTNVFRTAQTFGSAPTYNDVLGETGWNHSNGDGVLFYPGTDMVYSSESLGLAGPIASLRLKHWRRGVQDIDYVTLAAAINPTRTRQIVESLVTKALWEVGVADQSDPTWQRTNIGWNPNPAAWEAARAELAAIIESVPQ